MRLRSLLVRPARELAPALREQLHGRAQRPVPAGVPTRAPAGARAPAKAPAPAPAERRRALSALAGAQHGVVDHRDLAELGFSRSAVSRLVAAGALHRRHRGVYAVGHTALSREGRWLAAVRAYGPTAGLSHREAAALHALRPTARSAIDVTSSAGRAGSHHGVVLHRSRLGAEDRAVVAGIPCTTVARTLVDLGDVLAPRAVERAVEEALRLAVFDLAAVLEVADRRWGTRGAAVAHDVLGAWQGGTWTRSELEERLLALVDAEGLPRPRCNHHVAGVEVDAAWPAARLAVELDGFAFHGRARADFERDRRREAVLDAAGWRVVRLSWRQLSERPDEVADRLRRHLGACP